MTRRAQPQLTYLNDPEALARHAADWLVAAAVAKDAPFAIALSGGSTPKRLYQLLATPPYAGTFPWGRVHWFWGDERFVPHDDPLSNYRMVHEAMLSRAPVPPENIHAIATEALTPEAAASDYEHTLQTFYGGGALIADQPLFDVNFLGLGADGHTASLFPGTAVLSERTRWVAPVIGAKAEPRITLTYPTLESSRQTVFLVAGADKRAVLERLLAGDPELPAAHIDPAGELLVFADKAATAAEK